jgi:hypothetical protein
VLLRARELEESNLADVPNNVIRRLCVSLSAVAFGNEKQHFFKQKLEFLYHICLFGLCCVYFAVLFQKLRVHVYPTKVLVNLENAPVDEAG